MLWFGKSVNQNTGGLDAFKNILCYGSAEKRWQEHGNDIHLKTSYVMVRRRATEFN